MNIPKTNNELAKLIQVRAAVDYMVLQEIRRMKQDGANGETTFPDRDIIRSILAKQFQFNKLHEAELQIKNGVYHKSRLVRLWWRLRRKIKKLFRL